MNFPKIPTQKIKRKNVQIEIKLNINVLCASVYLSIRGIKI